jgi:hypothetical protein
MLSAACTAAGRTCNSQLVTSTDGTHEPEQEVCASDAAGLLVRVSVVGRRPPLTAAQVFGRLKLLGPDPAHWTTQPLR